MSNHRQANNTSRPDALQQYRSLLDLCEAQLEAHTAAPIAQIRRDAARALLDDKDARLPRRHDEGFEYTDINDILAPDLGVNINRVNISGPDDEITLNCGLHSVPSIIGRTINDSFLSDNDMASALPQGVTVTSFSNADERMSRVIERHYAQIARANSDDATLTLSNALAQDGVLIHCDAGTHLDKPLQLVNFLCDMSTPDGKTLPVLALRRLLVVLEKNSSARILVCDHDNSVSDLSVALSVVEVALDDDARLDIYNLDENNGLSARIARTVAHLNRNSRLDIFSGTLKPGRTRNDFEVHLDGPGAQLRLNGMAILDADRVGDNSATVIHHAPHCQSNQTFKYLVADNARGAFEGLIRVDHGAVGTEAFQNDRNILADAGARMHARPQLEIYCDDVKCSHGAATGQLDQQALFYMRSRGIDLPQARSMLMNAFMADVIDTVALEPLRDRLRFIVEQRISGADSRCRNCVVNNSSNSQQS